MKIKGTKLAQIMYRKDLQDASGRDLIVGPVAGYMGVTDTYCFYLLEGDEYEEFREKWNSYKNTYDIPESVDSLYSINSDYLKEEKSEHVNKTIERQITESEDPVEFTGKTFSTKVPTNFRELFHKEALVLKGSDYYLLASRVFFKNILEMTYSSRIDEISMFGNGKLSPIVFHFDGDPRIVMMPFRNDSGDEIDFSIDKIIENA